MRIRVGIKWLLAFLCSLALLLNGCQERFQQSASANGKLTVVTTLFPVYDFVRVVGGDRVLPVLLLPPGVEPHSFEPRPDDIKSIAGSSLFVYTHSQMEPWVEKLFKGMSKGPAVCEAGKNVTLLPAHTPGIDRDGHDEKEHGHHHHSYDPHIWLDPANAMIMVQTIRDEFCRIDPSHAQEYTQRAQTYLEALRLLDADYVQKLGKLKNRTIIHGGHYAFGYLAKRYNLTYYAAMSVHANAEPGSADLARLVKQIRQNKIKSIFSEALVSPRITEVLARETNTKIYILKNGHNISKKDMDNGVGYLDIMRDNLQALNEGLLRK